MVPKLLLDVTGDEGLRFLILTTMLTKPVADKVSMLPTFSRATPVRKPTLPNDTRRDTALHCISLCRLSKYLFVSDVEAK
jgi:hypothetical protein